ncbi:hypothetical protein ABIA32_004032 [Streptacidiphilus sp. MAP12-20]|uniref:hypothetical protein n=1 Tax=Streptacidiphilus sp. MAP12-20 TaxID=3156299 RepID=UPI003513EE9F
MSHPDELLVAIAALVETEGSNQMPLTVVVPGAVITGRLAPEAVWKKRVAEVLEASDRLGAFAALFVPPAERGPTEPTDGPDRQDRPDRPTHLHVHLARILQGSYGLPHTGGMYRIAIDQISSWTVGDLSYSDQ